LANIFNTLVNGINVYSSRSPNGVCPILIQQEKILGLLPNYIDIKSVTLEDKTSETKVILEEYLGESVSIEGDSIKLNNPSYIKEFKRKNIMPSYSMPQLDFTASTSQEIVIRDKPIEKQHIKIPDSVKKTKELLPKIHNDNSCNIGSIEPASEKKVKNLTRKPIKTVFTITDLTKPQEDANDCKKRKAPISNEGSAEKGYQNLKRTADAIIPITNTKLKHKKAKLIPDDIDNIFKNLAPKQSKITLRRKTV